MAFEIRPINGDFVGEVLGVDPGLEVDEDQAQVCSWKSGLCLVDFYARYCQVEVTRASRPRWSDVSVQVTRRT